LFFWNRFHLFLKDRNIFKAILAFYEKDYKSSKGLLEKALLNDQKNFLVYFYLGEIAEKQLQINKAINYFKKTDRYFKMFN